MNRLALLLTLPVLLALLGCAEQVSMNSPQQRVIASDDPQPVLSAAAAILQREFGRVRVNSEAGRIETAAREYTTDRDSGTARDLYRGPSTMRRKALFQVNRRGDRTLASLRIDIERRETAQRSVARPRGQRLSDRPGDETPIFVDAATTERQNTVWTRVRRDRRLERALLDELRARFAESRPEREIRPEPVVQPERTTPPDESTTATGITD